MLICLWKGCEHVFEEIAAFQEHVNKHVQQQQQLNLDNHKNVATKEEEEEERPIAKINQEEQMKKFGDEREIIPMAIEVWVDVFGFIKRIQLANSISLINRNIHQICWPYLHGNKVVAHEVTNIIFARRNSQPVTALLLKELQEVPFADCPPPDYISGFFNIQIAFLDHQVLAFFKLICHRINTNGVAIHFYMEMSKLDENQRFSVNALLQIFRDENLPIICTIRLTDIKYLPNVDNKTCQIYLGLKEESEIGILMELCTTPRPDGKQRVMHLLHTAEDIVQKLLETIKKDFHAADQPVPQPFYLEFYHWNLIPMSEEENHQTHETLIIDYINERCHIYRHPKGQHEQLAENARTRVQYQNRTDIVLKI